MSLFAHPHRRLILMRHGQSAYNAENRFTGLHDPSLTDAGVSEARVAADVLRDAGVRIDDVFISALRRTRETADVLQGQLGFIASSVIADAAFNERDYGNLSGLDKDQVRSRWGEVQVARWRRSYAEAPPNGESLRDTVARVLPFFLRSILPRLLQRRTVLVIAHGNSLRALVMALEGLSPAAVEDLEIPTGEVRVYELAPDSLVVRKAVHRRGGDWIDESLTPPEHESDADFYRRALQEEEDAEH